MDNWQINADDIAIRAGKAIDGAPYADEERRARVSTAEAKRARAEQSENARDARMTNLQEALRTSGLAAREPREAGRDPPAKPAASKPQKTTEGEKGAVGLNDHSVTFGLPRAQAAGNCEWRWGIDDLDEPLPHLRAWGTYATIFAGDSSSFERAPGRGNLGRVASAVAGDGPTGRLARAPPEQIPRFARLFEIALGVPPGMPRCPTPWECGACRCLLGQEW